MKLSVWAILFLIVMLAPVAMGWKKFGLGILVVPAVAIFLAYKAGAR